VYNWVQNRKFKGGYQMRIRRTADVGAEGDRGVVISVKMSNGDWENTWEETDYTRREQKAFGDSVALMAEIIADVYNDDIGCNCLVAMREGLKEVLRKIEKARNSRIIIDTP